MGTQRIKFQKKLSGLALLLLAAPIFAGVDKSISKHQQSFENAAMQIWDWNEVGYQETKSSGLLQGLLAENNFSITTGVAEIPTAFIAEFGSKGPVIAIMGEFDALPGIVQTSNPFRDVREGAAAGHACGHHMFGAASAWAAVAVKEWLEDNNVEGRIRFYGTPAEEGGSGKVYMVREGLFDDVDVVLHWHPDSANGAPSRTSNSNKSAKFTFKGISAHAAGSPHKGRSALDGVEAMNMMVNMMREHIPQESRIHYVITKGGEAPNVIPDHAEVYYYVRHPEMKQVEELFERVVNTARGAATGTDTTMTYEVMHGNYSLLPNDVLQKLMHAKLAARGGIKYNKEEQAFAEEIYQTLLSPSLEIGDQEKVNPWRTSHGYGSTDVGDVSWVVPTAGARIATWVPGTAGHSWQAVAAGGTSIGLKGTKLAAEVLADTAIALYQAPETIAQAKAERLQRVGKDFDYIPLLGDRSPPLDYRK